MDISMVTEYPRMDISIAIIILYLGILYFPSLRHLALNMALTRRRVLQMHDDFALWWKGIYGEEPDPELPVALKLPPNVIAQIASHLTPVDVALFAQTSRGVRAALGPDANASRLPRDQYFAYLATRVRGLPKRWLCEGCMELHRTCEKDWPSASWDTFYCPRGWAVSALTSNPTVWATTPRRSCRPMRRHHRHVQLALKYTRLRLPEYRDYLGHLMAPHSDIQVDNTGICGTHYMSESKIVAVGGADDDDNSNTNNTNNSLRYLVHASWRYHIRDRGPLPLSQLRHHMICPHLEMNHHSAAPWFRASPFAHDACEVFSLAVEASLSTPSPCEDTLPLQEKKQRELGQWPQAEEHRGACPRCATDFSVQRFADYSFVGSPHFLRIQSWQDLGPEGSPTDLVWRAQAHGRSLAGVENWRLSGPVYYHEPGSVRRWFEERPDVTF
ncbi:uncharacterized protein GGS25DRAFT_529456 [Hypoxylon fragiforme]|uniref:uncharacterized protein n=1 Tax=Hypoxylon fragiforme TaxID=63214 RepID=UPI0020C644DB|nr:uncharacterized protein GGS25DRAFT_529456 [Hypoxylon fragiforme]KAI2612979.1 hypothetical protein GGS25DRAFT_529456 [Hypoxylon fragiforme]